MKRRHEFHLYIPSEHRKEWQEFLDYCEKSGNSASRIAVNTIMANWDNPKRRVREEPVLACSIRTRRKNN